MKIEHHPDRIVCPQCGEAFDTDWTSRRWVFRRDGTSRSKLSHAHDGELVAAVGGRPPVECDRLPRDTFEALLAVGTMSPSLSRMPPRVASRVRRAATVSPLDPLVNIVRHGGDARAVVTSRGRAMLGLHYHATRGAFDG